MIITCSKSSDTISMLQHQLNEVSKSEARYKIEVEGLTTRLDRADSRYTQLEISKHEIMKMQSKHHQCSKLLT